VAVAPTGATAPTGPIIGPRRWPPDEPATVREPSNRLTVEVVTVSGRAAAVELRLGPDRVEIWHYLSKIAVFDRAALRDWLADPDRPLAEGKAVFSLDHLIDVDGRIALSLPDVVVWPFSPKDLDLLRNRV
jgi:hypothetical protein